MSRWDFGGNFADATAMAITRFFVEHGAQAPASRTIAEGARMSPSSLSNHFGGREAMLRRSVASWATFHTEELDDRVHRREWDGFLPLDEDEVAKARAWWCWRAIAVADPEMSAAIDQAQRAQERIVRMVLYREGANYEDQSLPIRLTSHYLDGLVAAVADPVRPLARDDAARVWEEQHARLLAGAEGA